VGSGRLFSLNPAKLEGLSAGLNHSDSGSTPSPLRPIVPNRSQSSGQPVSNSPSHSWSGPGGSGAAVRGAPVDEQVYIEEAALPSGGRYVSGRRSGIRRWERGLLDGNWRLSTALAANRGGADGCARRDQQRHPGAQGDRVPGLSGDGIPGTQGLRPPARRRPIALPHSAKKRKILRDGGYWSSRGSSTKPPQAVLKKPVLFSCFLLADMLECCVIRDLRAASLSSSGPIRSP
jgi:hypothetical protein